MKLILSRKGFDSTYGGVPSPILPDGVLCPLPIPSGELPRFQDVLWKGAPLSTIVAALTNRRIKPTAGVHLDPDLQFAARPRASGWMPLFGQVGAAQSHLQAKGVGIGDLFLFFGWFRSTHRVNGRLAYDPAMPDLHVLFGWLRVERVLHPTTQSCRIPRWATEHPHVQRAPLMATNNTLYVASRLLNLPGIEAAIPGAGVFEHHAPCLTLTAPAQRRSLWRLPGWMFPCAGKPPLSYHSDQSRWRREATGCYLQTVGRGQEFVLDCDRFPQALGWLIELFAGRGKRP